MEWMIESFRENMNLEHHESRKIFLFILKAISGIAFIFILGYLAAGGTVDRMVWLILLLGAIFDLVPELITIRAMNALNATAQHAEQIQLVLAALAYLVLATTVILGTPVQPFTGYAVFATLWIISFMIQQSVFFLWSSE